MRTRRGKPVVVDESGVEKKGSKIVEVWYSRDIKLSKDYNAAGMSLGGKATVENGKPKAALKKLKAYVDAQTKREFKDIVSFLNKLARTSNR